MIPPLDALETLRSGNRRFAEGRGGRVALSTPWLREQLALGQTPFATVLGCSDSRVPVETVFDQAPGDLFVIRVAGNVVAPSLAGSVEFASEAFGTRLVVVLGHSQCGAVQKTLEELHRPAEQNSPNLRAIVERIRPALSGLPDRWLEDPEAAAAEAVRANVRHSVEQLKHHSEILERLVDGGELLVVGAEYSLETGLVEFLDD